MHPDECKHGRPRSLSDVPARARRREPGGHRYIGRPRKEVRRTRQATPPALFIGAVSQGRPTPRTRALPAGRPATSAQTTRGTAAAGWRQSRESEKDRQERKESCRRRSPWICRPASCLSRRQERHAGVVDRQNSVQGDRSCASSQSRDRALAQPGCRASLLPRSGQPGEKGIVGGRCRRA